MTKEAKIGMLTGLVVIVLIGVLLSEYLGGGSPANGSGTMAALPVGNEYRQQVMSPVGVPPSGLNGGQEQTAQIVTSLGDVPPAYAMEGQPVAEGSPLVGSPVEAIAAGQMPIGIPHSGNVPTISVPDMVQPAPQGVVKKEYVIQDGDNLAKIAKMAYGSSKNSDLQRIVAANPGVLKDAGTMLMVGKKLVIPVVQGPQQSQQTVVPMGQGAVRSTVSPQGNGTNGGTVYVVQSGDTLEKIAKRLSPQRPTDMVQKLVSVNNIKDASRLQVGMKLKVPG